MEDVQEVNERCAHKKKVQQGHVSIRESVGGSLKVVGGGMFHLIQASLRLFAFWHVSTEIV